MAVEGGTRVIKYLLFIFNILFLLAGIALIIVGAIVAAKMAPYSSVAGISFNGVGVFIIIIGIVTFIIAFFGCLGAYKENYCLLVVFIILMVLILLCLIAALIAGFVMRNKVYKLVTDGLNSTIAAYNPSKKYNVTTKFWDSLQSDFGCCGAYNYTDYVNNEELYKNKTVPDSCCSDQSKGCPGYGTVETGAGVYTKGCGPQLSDLIYNNMAAAGGVAAAIAILIFIGILLASCMTHGLRKSYNTV